MPTHRIGIRISGFPAVVMIAGDLSIVGVPGAAEGGPTKTERGYYQKNCPEPSWHIHFAPPVGVLSGHPYLIGAEEFHS